MCVCPGPGEAPSNTPSILALLETLQNGAHLEVHKDMIRWILKVRHYSQGHFVQSLQVACLLEQQPAGAVCQGDAL